MLPTSTSVILYSEPHTRTHARTHTHTHTRTHTHTHPTRARVRTHPHAQSRRRAYLCSCFEQGRPRGSARRCAGRASEAAPVAADVQCDVGRTPGRSLLEKKTRRTSAPATQPSCRSALGRQAAVVFQRRQPVDVHFGNGGGDDDSVRSPRQGIGARAVGRIVGWHPLPAHRAKRQAPVDC